MKRKTKLSKRDRTALKKFAEGIHDIVLWNEDFENYFKFSLPKKEKKILRKLARYILKNDVYRLLDWLDFPTFEENK